MGVWPALRYVSLARSGSVSSAKPAKTTKQAFSNNVPESLKFHPSNRRVLGTGSTWTVRDTR
jgi:hypothetical protein